VQKLTGLRNPALVQTVRYVGSGVDRAQGSRGILTPPVLLTIERGCPDIGSMAAISKEVRHTIIWTREAMLTELGGKGR